jgi:hypothetical protein
MHLALLLVAVQVQQVRVQQVRVQQVRVVNNQISVPKAKAQAAAGQHNLKYLRLVPKANLGKKLTALCFTTPEAVDSMLQSALCSHAA